MGICSICGEPTIDDNHMCNDCQNGFASKQDETIIQENIKEEVIVGKNNCKICNKLTSQDFICVECLQEYQPKIKEYLNKYPSMSYLEAVGSKNIPVPRKVFYEFCEANIIKVK